MLTRVTPLDGESILPLADAKAHLRVLHDDEDTMIGQLRDAAISHVERVSGVALAEGDWRWSRSIFTTPVALPIGPVSARSPAVSACRAMPTGSIPIPTLTTACSPTIPPARWPV